MKNTIERRYYSHFLPILAIFLMTIPILGAKSCNDPPKSYESDLKAVDWCYFGGEGSSEIKFYGIVENVGKKPISGPGQYQIGASAGGPILLEKFKLSSAPHWEVGVGETVKLDHTISLPYHSNNKYDFSFSVFELQQDQNMSNNELKGFVGATTEWIKNSGKECKWN